jgi:hypothetical protein
MHVGGVDGEPIFFQKPSAFDCGTNGLCKSGVWGSSQLEDHSRLMKGHYAFVSNTFRTQDPFLVMNDQIVQHPWEQSPC